MAVVLQRWATNLQEFASSLLNKLIQQTHQQTIQIHVKPHKTHATTTTTTTAAAAATTTTTTTATATATTTKHNNDNNNVSLSLYIYIHICWYYY